MKLRNETIGNCHFSHSTAQCKLSTCNGNHNAIQNINGKCNVSLH